MNSIFSVDDFSDLLWPPMPAHPPVMSRSPSEWELEKFLEEFPVPTSSSTSDSIPSAVSESPTLSRPRNGEDDVVEIEKPEIHPSPPPVPLPPRNRLHQPSDRASLAPADSEDYRAFLKSQLDLACAAAAKARVCLHIDTLLCTFFFFGVLVNCKFRDTRCLVDFCECY